MVKKFGVANPAISKKTLSRFNKAKSKCNEGRQKKDEYNIYIFNILRKISFKVLSFEEDPTHKSEHKKNLIQAQGFICMCWNALFDAWKNLLDDF